MLGATKFAEVIKSSKTTTEALRFFGLENIGGNNRTIWSRIRELDLNTEHFSTLSTWQKSKDWMVSPVALESVMVPNSTYSRASLKRRLIRNGILENKCSICGMLPRWNDKVLVLRLDHKNGIRNDNRLENLRLACPNCDSQLDTFSGRNKIRIEPRLKTDRRRREKPLLACIDCGKKVKNKSTKRCASCAGTFRWSSAGPRKALWPSINDLRLEIISTSKSAVASRLGVSEGAVRKMLKRMEKKLIIFPDQPMVGSETLNL